VGSWTVIVALGVLAVLRILHVDGTTVMIVAISLTPVLYLPAYVVLTFGAVTRRLALAVVSAVLVVLHLVLVVPQLRPVFSRPSVTRDAARLRVFDANVRYTNADMSELAAEITAAKPDLVVLEEPTRRQVAALKQSGAFTRYAWSLLAAAPGSSGFAVWSDVPATGLQVWYAGQHPEVRGWLTIGGAQVRFYAVHTDEPVGKGAASMWRAQLNDIRNALRSEPHPLLVAGDFNATWDHPQFQAILHDGLRDAAVLAGDGWEMSWPRDLPVLPPFVRIDHVLVSRGIHVVGFRLGHGQGSDHRPLVVDLAF
jgi:endonuclease/exonuclease/phosphatase (EEP) superfamily protein YafD